MSLEPIRPAITAAPSGYLVAYLSGIPVEKWAAFAALVWTVGLMVQNWLWKPWLKPKYARIRARSKRHGRTAS